MTTETTQPPAEPTPPRPPKSECPDCHTKLVGADNCKADGIKARADYNEEHRQVLETARTQYETARTTYRKNRTDKALQVEDLRHQAKLLVERVRCQIKQKRVVRCLDECFTEICEELDHCQGPHGCEPADCTFDVTPSTEDDLDARIAEYERRITDLTKRRDSAKTRFDRLVNESTALLTRVDAAKARVDKLASDVAGDPALHDLKALYAEGRVIRRLLREAQIWDGFATTKAYLDCLCEALTCWIDASSAVSRLTGRKAVEDCHKKAVDERCTRLTDHTADEVTNLYEQRCGQPDDCDPPPSDDDDDCADDEPPSPPPSDDCGCHHHHHHHPCHHHDHPGHKPEGGSDDDCCGDPETEE